MPAVIRIGEAYHSNELMLFLAELGLRADSSCLPGRKRSDDEKLFNWESSPNHPYHPSSHDYRIPGMPELRFWEIPMNTVLTKVSYDKAPLLRYYNPAFHPAAFNEGMAAFLSEHRIVVTVMHPFEIIADLFSDSKEKAHPLISFDIRAVEKNIKAIMSTAYSIGKKVRFVTMNELLDHLDNGICNG
jgi:hypothetical protein